jgi:hypothetical protein
MPLYHLTDAAGLPVEVYCEEEIPAEQLEVLVRLVRGDEPPESPPTSPASGEEGSPAE